MGNYNSNKRYVATVWTEPPELATTANEFRPVRKTFDTLLPAIKWCNVNVVKAPHATGSAEVYDDHNDEVAWHNLDDDD
jgi:hypothetical protein